MHKKFDRLVPSNPVRFTQEQLEWLDNTFPELTDPNVSDAELRANVGARRVIKKIASMLEQGKLANIGG